MNKVYGLLAETSASIEKTTFSVQYYSVNTISTFTDFISSKYLKSSLNSFLIDE